jgi:hypothetical protein
MLEVFRLILLTRRQYRESSLTLFLHGLFFGVLTVPKVSDKSFSVAGATLMDNKCCTALHGGYIYTEMWLDRIDSTRPRRSIDFIKFKKKVLYCPCL